MHTPKRMCIACRQMKEKAELIRIVKGIEGVKIDLSGKSDGRGAYICRNHECVEGAKKRRALSKHFKTAVDDKIYDAVSEAVRSE